MLTPAIYDLINLHFAPTEHLGFVCFFIQTNIDFAVNPLE